MWFAMNSHVHIFAAQKSLAVLTSTHTHETTAIISYTCNYTNDTNGRKILVNFGGKNETHTTSTVRTDDFELECAAAATALVDRNTQVLALVAGAHVIHVARDALVSRQCDVTALVVSQVSHVHGVLVPEDICGNKRLRFNSDVKAIGADVRTRQLHIVRSLPHYLTRLYKYLYQRMHQKLFQ